MKSELDRRQAEMRSRWTRKEPYRRRKLTRVQERELKRFREQGASYETLANIYGISESGAWVYVVRR